MNLRDFSRYFLVSAGVLALGAFAHAGSKQPNIIFIFVDDLGWGDVGVFNQNARRASGDRSQPSFLTPSLDRMANEGARFTHHYVGAPVCITSRASLLQGVTQGHTNIRDNQFDKALDENHTLASVLKQGGYTTAVIGKWGMQGADDAPAPNWPAHPLNRGFDYYYGYIRHVDGHEHYPKEMIYFQEKAKTRGPIVVWENRTDATAPLDKCYTTDLWTARAKKWITETNASDPKKPFFLYLAYDTPHAVLELPTTAYPKGGGKHGGVQWLGTPGHAITTATGTPDSWMDPDYANATYDDDHNPATPEKPWPDVYCRYATSVRRIDDGVGDLMQLLRDLKIDDNTLVIFASDNGPSIESYLPEEYSPEFFGSFGPFDGIKRDCWEGGMRTPAIVHWPKGIKAGGVIAAPTGTWDWLPTFAEFAGLPAPARADGISLVPLLTGKGESPTREALYFEYAMQGKTPDFPVFEANHRNRKRGQMQAVRLGDLVGVRYDIKSAKDAFEIYDVVNDPKETKNLAHDPAFAATQARMQALALQSRRPNASAPRPYDNELVPASSVASTQPGLAWSAYAGDFPWLPAFADLKPKTKGQSSTIDLGPLRGEKISGLFFTGYINVPVDGDYTFSLATDTGAAMRIHDATVIDADFGYQPGTAKTATIKLQAGFHPIRLSYRTIKGATPALTLQWSGPNLAQQAIPVSALSH